MQRSDVRPSTRLSVPSIDSSSGVRLFAAERGRLQQILIVKLQIAAVRNKCGSVA